MSEVADRTEPVMDVGALCAWCGDALDVGQDAVWIDGERGHAECADDLQTSEH